MPTKLELEHELAVRDATIKRLRRQVEQKGQDTLQLKIQEYENAIAEYQQEIQEKDDLLEGAQEMIDDIRGDIAMYEQRCSDMEQFISFVESSDTYSGPRFYSSVDEENEVAEEEADEVEELCDGEEVKKDV